MQQTVVEYINPALKAKVEEEIFSLLGLTHSQRQHLNSPHQQSLSEAENHTVILLGIFWQKIGKMLEAIYSQLIFK